MDQAPRPEDLPAAAMELLPLGNPEEVPPPALVPPEHYRRLPTTPEPHQELKLPPFFRAKVSVYLNRTIPGASRFPSEPSRLVQEAHVRFIPARNHKWKQVIRITDEDTAVLPSQELRGHLMTIVNDIQEGLTMSTLWAQTRRVATAPWVPLYILDPSDPFQGHGKIQVEEGSLSYLYHGYPVKMAQQDEVQRLHQSSSRGGSPPLSPGTHRRCSSPSPGERSKKITVVEIPTPVRSSPSQCWTTFKPTNEEVLILTISLIIGILLGMLFIIVLVSHCPYWEECHPMVFPFKKCPVNASDTIRCSCPL